MKKSIYLGFVAATAVFAGCMTSCPPPPAPSKPVVYVGTGNADPVSEYICGQVAGNAAKEGSTYVVRDENAPGVGTFVWFDFSAYEKAKLDEWCVYTGVLSMKAVVRNSVAGDVLLAEEKVVLHGPRRLGKDKAIGALMEPLCEAADKWYKANVTPANIEKASK